MIPSSLPSNEFSYTPPQSKEMKSITRKVKYCFIVPYVTLAAVTTVFLNGFGINDLISALFLYLATYTLRSCYISFYLIFSAFNIITAIAVFGKMFQNHIPEKNRKFQKSEIFVMVVLGFYILVYFCGCSVVYKFYKETKAFELGYSSSGTGVAIRRGNHYNNYGSLGQRDDEEEGFTPFQGGGVQIG